MRLLKQLLYATLIILLTNGSSVIAVESVNEQISLFDFKDTPITDVLKTFTDLTGQNVVAAKDIADLRITLFLKAVNPKEALGTMCKLYNLWYREDGNVIRIMSIKDYNKELMVRYDERTSIYKLKYASCLAIADLLESLYGDRIAYVKPEELESYGHIGTDGNVDDIFGDIGIGRGDSRTGGKGYKARTARYDATYAATKEVEAALDIEKDLNARRIEELESRMSKKKEITAEDILEVKQQKAIIYLAVFPRNNTIVARSVDTRILKDIGELIKKVDTPTLQVLLEGKILELTLTDNFDSFFDLDYTDGDNTLDLGNFTSLSQSTVLYSFINSHINARMELFEENDRLKIISSPMISCANNAPGEFFIGEERPITVNYEFEVREYEERTTEVIRPVIELREVGTKLTIIPSINENKTVTMRLLAEISTVNIDGADIDLVNDEGDVITLSIDTIDTSIVENIIVAQDGATLAIGGLIRERDRDYEKKVPFLGDIPLLGVLFKKKGIEKSKTETVILITPHIMTTPGEGQDVSNKVTDRLSDHPYIKDDQERLLEYQGGQKPLEPISIEKTRSEQKKGQEEFKVGWKGIENKEKQKELFGIRQKETSQHNREKSKDNKQSDSRIITFSSSAGEILRVNREYNFVLLDFGCQDGIGVGDTFRVLSENKHNLVGQIKISQLYQSVSLADIVSEIEPGTIKEGDRVVR